MADPIDAEVVQRYEHETRTRCATTYIDHFAGLTRENLEAYLDGGRLCFSPRGPSGHGIKTRIAFVEETACRSINAAA